MDELRAHLPPDAVAPAQWLLASLEGQDLDAMGDLLDALERHRNRRRREQDQDVERRVLVGPRLPRWMVERYRADARARGQSLYQWATEALEAHLKGGSNGGTE